MSDEADIEIYASLTDLDFEFDELVYISLTEIADDCGNSPLSYLRKAIRKRRSIFARLRGSGAIITGKKLGDYHNISLKVQLWNLPYDNLKKMMFEKPPWEITSLYRPDVIYGKTDVQFRFRPEPFDENDLFLNKKETINEYKTIDEVETDDGRKENTLNDFDHLVLRTMMREGKSFQVVKYGLKKHLNKNESIKNIDISNSAGEMKKGFMFESIQLPEYKRMYSTLQKKCTYYKKILRNYSYRVRAE
jgi:hypothetical protein